MTPAAQTTSLRRGYTQCRYGQLHYLQSRPDSAADESAPTLVLLHQNPSSSQEYQRLAQAMGSDRRVIAFDTPGSGMSDWPPAPEPIDRLAGAFADGLDNLGFGKHAKIDVFGYHTGTLLAAELAVSRTNLVRRVVLSGIPFRSETERAERLAAARQTPAATADGAAVMERFAALWRYVVTQRDPRVDLHRAATLFMEKAKSMDRFWWPYEGVWSYSVPDRFRLISQPTLVLQPWEDLLEQSRKAAGFLVNGHLVELPSVSRDVFEVGVDDFARELRRFLSQEQ